MPEFIDPVFTKTSPKCSFSVKGNERFGLVFAKSGSINSGSVLLRLSLAGSKEGQTTFVPLWDRMEIGGSVVMDSNLYCKGNLITRGSLIDVVYLG